LLAETLTTPAGLAASPPETAEPPDIITRERSATKVPAAALSGHEDDAGLNVTPLGVGGVGVAALTVIGVAVSLRRVFIPFARTRTEKLPGATNPAHTVIRLLAEIAK
jgi:hypothetical protein